MGELERAIVIAAQAHAGQVDKAGEPYILHPLRVMLSVAGHDERLAAILHDVVEDSSVTIEQLRREGFGEAVLAAIDALTRRPGESKMDAAARAKTNPIALRIKLADNADNTAMVRKPDPSDEDRARLQEHAATRAFLES